MREGGREGGKGIWCEVSLHFSLVATLKGSSLLFSVREDERLTINDDLPVDTKLGKSQYITTLLYSVKTLLSVHGKRYAQ